MYKVKCHPSRSKLFASCSIDTTVKVWNIDESSPIHTLEGHFGYVIDLKWIENSDLVVSASFDGTLKIWNTK